MRRLPVLALLLFLVGFVIQSPLAHAQENVFGEEVLAGWTEDASEDVGAPAGSFVPYLHLFATVQNEETGQVKTATFVPHINQSDNVHYARNIALPGGPDDPYTVVFEVHPPEQFELATHEDWRTA